MSGEWRVGVATRPHCELAQALSGTRTCTRCILAGERARLVLSRQPIQQAVAPVVVACS